MHGREGQAWLTRQVDRYRATGERVTARALSAPEAAEALLAGTVKADLYCATSTAEFALVNRAFASAGRAKPLAGAGTSVARSPLVLAMPAEAAQVLGWPEKPIGWKELAAWVQDTKSWRAREKLPWEPFRLAHAHPEHDAAGLLALLAEAQAANGKEPGSAAELSRASVQEMIGRYERTTPVYGESTALHLRALTEHGPRYASAVVAFESQVIESRLEGGGRFPLVALYPTEGAPVADHPCVVLSADWVTPERRAAAEKFVASLRSPEAQEEARKLGLRPADPMATLSAPLDLEHGVAPAAAGPAWPIPGEDVVLAALDGWKRQKRRYSHFVVLDRSEQMSGPLLDQARETIREMLAALGSLPGELAFNYFPVDPDPLEPRRPGQIAVLPKPSIVQAPIEMPGLKNYEPYDKLVPKGPSVLADAIADARGVSNAQVAGALQFMEQHGLQASIPIVFTAGVEEQSILRGEGIIELLNYRQPKPIYPDFSQLPEEPPPGPPPPDRIAPTEEDELWQRSPPSKEVKPGPAAELPKLEPVPPYQLTIPVILVVYGEKADWKALEAIAVASGGLVIDARGQTPKAIARRLVSFF